MVHIKLEELILKRLAEWQELQELLTEYGGRPAIFFRTAPGDQQKNWRDKSQYPRIIFDLNMQADTERKTSGTLVISVLCDATGIDPETISTQITDCMKDIIIKPDDSYPYCFAWLRSDAFELEHNQQNTSASRTIIGQEIRFDLLEYPMQLNTDPDPTEAMNDFIKECFPSFFVLWKDDFEHYMSVTEDRPVIFVRTMSCENTLNTMAIAFMETKIAIHVIAPDSGSRAKWARCILNAMAVKGEAKMTNGAPLLFKGTVANNVMDYLVNGQIVLTGQYTMLRSIGGSEVPLGDISIKGGLENGNS